MLEEDAVRDEDVARVLEGADGDPDRIRDNMRREMEGKDFGPLLTSPQGGHPEPPTISFREVNPFSLWVRAGVVHSIVFASRVEGWGLGLGWTHTHTHTHTPARSELISVRAEGPHDTGYPPPTLPCHMMLATPPPLPCPAT